MISGRNCKATSMKEGNRTKSDRTEEDVVEEIGESATGNKTENGNLRKNNNTGIKNALNERSHEKSNGLVNAKVKNIDNRARADTNGVDKRHGYHGVGRRGDPRMNRAVATRQANPNMSLQEALIAGGFRFPNELPSNGNGKLDRTVLDSDNVLLSQRKNQLSRRLRLAKRRPHEAKTEVDSFVKQIAQNNDAAVPSSLIASSLQPELRSNLASKRSYSRQISDEYPPSCRLKGTHDGTNQGPSDESNLSLYSSMRTLPGASFSPYLQQQHQGLLGQSHGLIDGTNFHPMQQGLLNNPFLQNQVPLNFGLQNASLNQYLEIAALQMQIENQSLSAPLQNITSTHSQLLNQSALQNLFAAVNSPADY